MSTSQSYDNHGLVVLTRAECLQLLDRAVVGRVGLTVSALPVIFPVNYALLDDDIVVRTGWGTKLRAATHNQVVCFEADGFDPAVREGWSVLATGRAAVVEDPELLARVHALPLEAWAPAPRDHYVLIRAELMSGRRIGPKATVERT